MLGLIWLIDYIEIDDLIYFLFSQEDYIQSLYDFFNTLQSNNDDNDDDGNDDDDADGDNNPFEKDSETPQPAIRYFRPPHLEFRVGDVVLTSHMHIGVIIGWMIDMSVSYFLVSPASWWMRNGNHSIVVDFLPTQQSMVRVEWHLM